VTKAEIFEKLKLLIVDVLGVRDDEIHMDSALAGDLGAESIDLLDLSFLIEQKFGITLETYEIEEEAKHHIPGGEYEKDGYLTPEALEELKKIMPGVPPEKFRPGLRRTDVPGLLTVGVFVSLIQRKLNERQQR